MLTVPTTWRHDVMLTSLMIGLLEPRVGLRRFAWTILYRTRCT